MTNNLTPRILRCFRQRNMLRSKSVTLADFENFDIVLAENTSFHLDCQYFLIKFFSYPLNDIVNIKFLVETKKKQKKKHLKIYSKTTQMPKVQNMFLLRIKKQLKMTNVQNMSLLLILRFSISYFANCLKKNELITGKTFGERGGAM